MDRAEVCLQAPRCRSRGVDLSRSGKGGAGRQGGRSARRSLVSADRRRAAANHHVEERGRRTAPLSSQHRASTGGGRHELFPGVQCGIGPPTDEGFFYDFVVPRPFVPGGSRGDRERRCASWRTRTSSSSGRCGRATRPSASFADRGEPLKVQLIEEKTEGQNEVSCYTIKDKETFVDFCVGPHVPSTGKAESVQAAQHVERVLEGRRAQSADAARVRHGVPVGEGAQGAPDADRRGEEARPPEDRSRPEALHVPRVGPGRHVLAGQRDDPVQHAGRLHARACSSPPATSR